MPLYLYSCPKCGYEEEIIKSINEIDREEFCECNNKYAMVRVVGNAGGFRLKGDGWGEDGYDKYIGDINNTRRINGQPDIGYDDIHNTNHNGDK